MENAVTKRERVETNTREMLMEA